MSSHDIANAASSSLAFFWGPEIRADKRPMPGQFLTRLPEIKPSPIVTVFDEHRQANSTPVRAAGFRMPEMA
ncbi:hypothetical protein [Rhizobium mongolense]|uniref:Uncharacterized protein n=1 Tax=Rhizobium mongolense TaxID=57676 RepID=A0A7W6RTI1_9HYPH|nr:hypothetical protein [Rhizobium mongolense]MBB4278336.1 hypothetical protein [Rhizobium mongolense]